MWSTGMAKNALFMTLVASAEQLEVHWGQFSLISMYSFALQVAQGPRMPRLVIFVQFWLNLLYTFYLTLLLYNSYILLLILYSFYISLICQTWVKLDFASIFCQFNILLNTISYYSKCEFMSNLSNLYILYN